MKMVAIMSAMPFATVGSILLRFFSGYAPQVTVLIGSVTLDGVAVEVGATMPFSVNQAYNAIGDTMAGLPPEEHSISRRRR